MKVHQRLTSLVTSRISATGLEGLGTSTKNGHHPQKGETSNELPRNENELPQNDEIIASSEDEMFLRLRREAAEVVKREPILCCLLSKAGLLDASALSDAGMAKSPCTDPAASFEEVVSRIVAHRLSSSSGGSENICPDFLRGLLLNAFRGDELEMGHTMSEAVREDASVVERRDPACETLLEAVLFMKGFHSLVLHRAARRAWKPARRGAEGENDNSGVTANGTSNGTANENGADQAENAETGVAGKRFVALLLQSQSASSLGIDIHPACSIGAGVMIDHASGVVIGETATVGDGTTILHGVTLGGTGKDHGDRHPKIGRDVLIGAGTKILGNITVGDRAKIGAGSVVLRPIPSGATAVGAPAKIIGYTPRGERPGSVVDVELKGVEPLLGKRDSAGSTVTTERTTVDSSGSLATMASISFAKEKGEKKDGDERGSRDSISDKEEGKAEKDSGEEEDDDDNVTDFGTPAKCRYVKVSSHNDGLCPFSGSFRITQMKDSISHSQLRALLIQEGCTEGECVEVFFALLHCTPASSKARQCGCIPCETFTANFPEIAREKTRLDEETIGALARGDLRALGMSKKASRRFKSVFSALGKQCLARIPSTNALKDSLREAPLRASERLRMTDHLDTDHYAEGITI